MKKFFIVIVTCLIVLSIVGCNQNKESNNNIDPTTIDASTGMTQNGSSNPLEIIYIIENEGHLMAIIKKEDQYYRYAVENVDNSFKLSNAVEYDSLELNHSTIKKIDGYLSGTYQVEKISDTMSSVVIIEEELGKHLDLLEIKHDAEATVLDVTVLDDFSKIYYTLLIENSATFYEHDLANNTTTELGDNSKNVYVDAKGNIFTYEKEVFEDASINYTVQKPVAKDTNVDPQVYDVVILNGIVTDPETKTYKFGYNIGIIGDTIETITLAEIQGNEVIDAKGLIVSPGFIDMLAFNLNSVSSKYKITDGVTTSLSMHGCTNDFESFFRSYGNNPPYVNYGGAVFAIKIRYEAGLGTHDKPSQKQIDFMASRVREEIEAGGLALAFSPEYYPGTTPDEIRAMMKVAAEYDIPTHFHSRYSAISGEFTGIDGVEEVIGYARELNARVHFMHLHSTGGTGMMEEALALINEANAEGYHVTYDIYPYDSWISRIDWARFNDGWQERYGITYSDLQMAGTSERLTKETFEYHKSLGGLCIAFAMNKEDYLLALSQDGAMVGSDTSINVEGSSGFHQRGAGTFSRILGKYVRDENVFSLMDGLKKMTINSAKHLEAFSPAMAERGRLQEGFIADITIFDYRIILDKSTPELPAQESIGINYVLVSGKVGVNENGLVSNYRGGKAIRSEFN